MPPGNTYIHKSAAKAFITDLEDGVPEGTPEELKQDIIYYGTTYGLTSRHTSFLAVDNGQPNPRPVGIVNSIFDVGQVASAFARNEQPPPATTRSAAPTLRRAPMARNFVSFAATDAGVDAQQDGNVGIDPSSKLAVLFQLAGFQRLDGGFGAKSSDVFMLLLPLGGITAQPVLEKYGVDEEVTAALLAWAWLTLCCGEEADGTREKTDSWIRGNAKGINVDGIQSELAQAVKFGSA
jgi:hypothetical protein